MTPKWFICLASTNREFRMFQAPSLGTIGWLSFTPYESFGAGNTRPVQSRTINYKFTDTNTNLITSEQRHLGVDGDAKLLAVLVFGEIHVGDGVEDLLLAHVGRSGGHLDHVRRLDVRQLPTVFLSGRDAADL